MTFPTPERTAHTPLLRDRYFRLTLLYSFVWMAFRLWFCTTLELVGDEAYYWLWSNQLDWCYYSKGPLVAWTMAAGTGIFGDTVFGIRCIAVLLSAGTGVLIFLLGRALFSSRAGFWTVVVASVTPLYVLGSILMTIDPLSVFFWAAAACLFWYVKDGDSVGGWALVGLLIGIGMLGKYTNIALIPSFLVFLLASREHRRRLARPGFWCMCIVALACLAPVVIWNAQHEWITMTHLRERGSLDQAWRISPSEFLQFLTQQLMVWFPLFLAGTVAAFFSSSLRRQHRTAYVYLCALALPLFCAYAILGLNDSGQPNWTAPTFVGGLLLMVAAWLDWGDRSKKARATSIVALVLAACVTVAFLAATRLRLPGERDPLTRVRGARDLAAQVAELRTETGAAFVIVSNYQLASLLRFYQPTAMPIYVPTSDVVHNQFHIWPGYGNEFTGQDAILVSKDERVAAAVQREFPSVELVRRTHAMHRGKPVREYYLYTCRGYRGTTPSPAGSE